MSVTYQLTTDRVLLLLSEPCAMLIIRNSDRRITFVTLQLSKCRWRFTCLLVTELSQQLDINVKNDGIYCLLTSVHTGCHRIVTR